MIFFIRLDTLVVSADHLGLHHGLTNANPVFRQSPGLLSNCGELGSASIHGRYGVSEDQSSAITSRIHSESALSCCHELRTKVTTYLISDP